MQLLLLKMVNCWLHLSYLVWAIAGTQPDRFLQNRLFLVSILEIDGIRIWLRALQSAPRISILRSLLLCIATKRTSICVTLNLRSNLSGQVLVFLLRKCLDWSNAFESVRRVWMVIYFLMASTLCQFFVSLYSRINLQRRSVTIPPLSDYQILFLLTFLILSLHLILKKLKLQLR